MKASSGVVLTTSRYWEGAYAVKRMMECGVPMTDVLVQKTWWRVSNGYEYSPEYLRKRELQLGSKERTHYTIEELVEGTGVRLQYVENINEQTRYLKKRNPAIIAVVGSRIIKRDVTETFVGRLLNYHTGILPEYRGPYSEFWAYYNDERDMVGTTIHLIEEGIDTGNIVAQEKVDVSECMDPQSAHVVNAMVGADLLAKAVRGYMDHAKKTYPQDPERARYFTYPTEQEIAELQRRLGKRYELTYAD